MRCRRRELLSATLRSRKSLGWLLVCRIIFQLVLAVGRGMLPYLDFVNKLPRSGTPGPCVGNIAPIPRLGFSGLCLHDGPLAIRQAVYASVFPAGLSVAASWDRSLAHERGVYMATEFRGKGAHVALGPVVGPLGRSPFAGRNWEGFSPDSYLSGAMVEDTIVGMQSTGVQACVKHFIMNEQETQRNPSRNKNGTTIEALSSNLDDKVRVSAMNNILKLISTTRLCMRPTSGRLRTRFGPGLLLSCALINVSTAGKHFRHTHEVLLANERN
jgi:hypothetical protein